ncbi:hypothetical protein WKT22_03180 [Candidatus Lokiarchaeum ossiferum]
MITGFSLYLAAINQYTFISNIESIADYELLQQNSNLIQTKGTTHLSLDFSSQFSQSNQLLSTSLEENRILYSDICKFAALRQTNGFYSLTKNKTNISDYEDVADLRTKLKDSPFEFVLFDKGFYHSSRFSQYFVISEGNIPNHNNEILIDYQTKEENNISIGEVVNLTLIMGDMVGFQSNRLQVGSSTIESLTIAGVYLPRIESYSIGKFSYTNRQIYRNAKIQNNSQINRYNPVVFMYSEFNNGPVEKNFQLAVDKLECDSNIQYFVHTMQIESGYWIFIERNGIDLSQLGMLSGTNKQKTNALQTDLSGSYLLHNHINLEIQNYISNETNISPFIILILLLPFILLAFFTTPFFYSIYERVERERLQSLLGRGLRSKIVTRRILFETLLTSLLTSIIATVFGLIVFFVYHLFLKDFFIIDRGSLLLPSLKIDSIIITVLISILVNIISSIKMIRNLHKINFTNLVEMTKKREKDVNFDEKSIYKPKKVQPSAFINKIRGSFQKSLKSENHKSRAKISTKTIFFILVGATPLLVYGFLYVAIETQINDNLIDISRFFIQNYRNINVFIYIGITFLIIGIVRMLFIEKPFFTANISRSISHLFVSDLDKLLGLDIIRKRKWSRMMSFIGIYIAILISSNMFYATQYTNSNSLDNIKVGADFTATLSYQSFSDIQDFNDFNSFLLKDEIINNFEYCFIDNESSLSISDEGSLIPYNCSLYTLDIANYITIIQENNKPLPNHNFEDKLGNLAKFSTNIQDKVVPILLSPYFLELIDKDIGDIVRVKHYVYNRNTNEKLMIPLDLQIQGEIEILPGIFAGRFDQMAVKAIFMDINWMNVSSQYFHGKTLINCMDLKVGSNQELNSIEDRIAAKFETKTNNLQYSTYNQDWNVLSNLRMTLNFGSNGFYKLIFNIFIVVGIVLGILSAPITKSLIDEDKKELQHLLKRGFRQKKFLKLFILEGTILFLQALGIGMIVGLFYSLVQNRISFQIFQYSNFGRISEYLSFPVRMEILEILGAISLSFGSFLLVFFSIFSPSLKDDEEDSDSLLLKYKSILGIFVVITFNLGVLLKISIGFQLGVQLLILWFLIEMLKTNSHSISRIILQFIYQHRSKVFVMASFGFFFNLPQLSVLQTRDKIGFSIIAIVGYFAVQAMIQEHIARKQGVKKLKPIY